MKLDYSKAYEKYHKESCEYREKARNWDELQLSISQMKSDGRKTTIGQMVAKLMNDSKQYKKLRELIEKFLETYHNCNPYKGKEDPLFFQDIQKILEESKK